VEGTGINQALIQQIAMANLVLTDQYLPGLKRVLEDNLSPIQALNEVE